MKEAFILRLPQKGMEMEKEALDYLPNLLFTF